MRRLLLLIPTILLLSLTDCDNREDVEGQWQSDDISLNMPNLASSTAKMVMTFSQDGRVTINTDINLIEHVGATGDDPMINNVVNIKAVASIDGSWRYSQGEDDEVDINLDHNTFSLTVDPNSIEFPAHEESPALESLKEKAIANYNAMLTQQMSIFFIKFTHLEDIKVTKGDNAYLTFEIDNFNGHDEHFTLYPI